MSYVYTRWSHVRTLVRDGNAKCLEKFIRRNLHWLSRTDGDLPTGILVHIFKLSPHSAFLLHSNQVLRFNLKTDNLCGFPVFPSDATLRDKATLQFMGAQLMVGADPTRNKHPLCQSALLLRSRLHERLKSFLKNRDLQEVVLDFVCFRYANVHQPRT